MKRMLLIATLLAASLTVQAEPSTDRALVEQYLASIQFQQVVSAQLEAYAEQLSKARTRPAKSRFDPT